MNRRWQKPIDRRLFLRGLGGAVVAAPFLSSVAERHAKGAGQTPAASGKRLIVMFTHYGCITTRFFPTKSHGVLTATDLQPTTLKHLVPYVDRLLMPRGIRAMNEWNINMTLGQGNDEHTQVVGSYFTCQPVAPNSNDPFSFDSGPKFNAMPVGPSLDHVIAQQLSPAGTPLLLRVGNRTDNPQSAISYAGPSTSFPGIGTLPAAMLSLTGLAPGGTSPDAYKAARGQSIIDLVRDDLDTLERFDMSQSDQNKLEAWKALLDATVTPVLSAGCTQDLATALGLTDVNLNAVGTGVGSDVLTSPITSGLDGADLYSNVAALAAACNANPVIVLKYPASYVFSGLGIDMDSASLAGRVGSAASTGNCVIDVLNLITKVDDFYTRKFAHLVQTLDGVGELDDSAVVWFQEVSDGAACNLNNLPIVQVGSAGGYFRTGCAVNVDDGSADLTTGNSEKYCADGQSDPISTLDKSTGTDPRLANAPINKYFCNLMNALGVKAGDDGFPKVGGAAPVTKYGMYDRTEDFIGGGTNPPLITSPGEYEALKAG